MKFLVINGPNLNLTQFSEPGVAGTIDYNGLLDYLEACCNQMEIEVEFFQSNHEATSSTRSSLPLAVLTALSSIRADTHITALPFWTRSASAACRLWK